jgi:hypothetical protein
MAMTSVEIPDERLPELEAYKDKLSTRPEILVYSRRS